MFIEFKSDIISKWKLILRYQETRQFSSRSGFTALQWVMQFSLVMLLNYSVNFLLFKLESHSYLFIRNLYEVMNFPFCAFSFYTYVKKCNIDYRFATVGLKKGVCQATITKPKVLNK